MLGRQPTYDEVSALSETLSEKALETFGSQSAQNIRTGATVGLGYAELEQKWAALKDKQATRGIDDWKDYYTNARDRIKYVMDHLEAQGVEKSGVGDFMALFSSGKKLDPLSPEDQGQALSGLFHLWNKVSNMKRLSPQEEYWMEDVLNAFQMRERGGVPSQETGLTGPETGRIDETTNRYASDQIRAVDEKLVQIFKQKYMEQGIAEPEADRMARQDVAGLSGIQ